MATGVGAMPHVEVAGPGEILHSAREAAPDLQSTWHFNCYSPGQACRGTGNTSGGGSGSVGCSPIDSRGCSQYSFDGGGQFKLCLFSDGECTNEFESVDGGKVTCIVLGTVPHSWKVVLRGHSCT